MTERIQPENNRTFITGSGDWAGDLEWSNTPLGGHDAYITGEMTPTQPEANISLAYPYIKPIPSKQNLLVFSAAAAELPESEICFEYHLTDGVYSYGWSLLYFFATGVWVGFGVAPTLPDDWNIENSSLMLRVYSPEGRIGKFAFDDFSLTVEVISKIQYLPLVGVG